MMFLIEHSFNFFHKYLPISHQGGGTAIIAVLSLTPLLYNKTRHRAFENIKDFNSGLIVLVNFYDIKTER